MALVTKLADQQDRQLDDRRLYRVLGQNVAREDTSFTNARGPTPELDRPGHRFPRTQSAAQLLGIPR